MDARLLDCDRADAGGDGAFGQVAIADHLAPAGGVATVPVAVDPVGDFGLDGLGEQLLGALAEDISKDILGLGQWHDGRFGGRTMHGGVLLCRVGTLVTFDTPRVRRLFSSRYPQHSIIPLRKAETSTAASFRSNSSRSSWLV